MVLLNRNFDVDRFFGRLQGARERVLLLDYDGTLAPFHRRPELAMPYPRVAELVALLKERHATRVVLVSGRRFADLRGPMTWLRHTEVWGGHGWERRTAGGERIDYDPPAPARRELQLAEASARELVRRGVRIERKRASIAVHWRGLAPRAASVAREFIEQAWHGHDPRHVQALAFDGGMELRVRGRDKGDAVRDVLANCSGDVACAYLGDDTTDEDAFDAIKGRGLAVLVRPERRETHADLWLAPPAELVGFLERWCAVAAGRAQ